MRLVVRLELKNMEAHGRLWGWGEESRAGGEDGVGGRVFVELSSSEACEHTCQAQLPKQSGSGFHFIARIADVRLRRGSLSVTLPLHHRNSTPPQSTGTPAPEETYSAQSGYQSPSTHQHCCWHALRHGPSRGTIDPQRSSPFVSSTSSPVHQPPADQLPAATGSSSQSPSS